MYPVEAASQRTQQNIAGPSPQDSKIEQIALPILQQAQEFIARVWRAIVIGFDEAFGKIELIFFSALHYLYPALGNPIHIGFLRIKHMVVAIQNAWALESNRAEIKELRLRNSALSEQNAHLHLNLTTLQEQLSRQQDSSQALNTTKTALEQQIPLLLSLLESAKASEAAVVIDRDILAQQQANSQQEKQALTQQLQTATFYNILLLIQNQQLYKQPVSPPPPDTAYKQILALATSQRPDLDDQREQLLHLLFNQISSTLATLRLRKEQTAGTSTSILINSAIESIEQLDKLLHGLWTSLRFHSAYQQQIGEVI